MNQELENAFNSMDLQRIVDVSREMLDRINEPSTLKTAIMYFLDDLKRLGVSVNKKGAKDYYKVRDMVFHPDRGLDDSKISRLKKAAALYWYKRSMKYGDLKFSHKYLNRYLDFDNPSKERIYKDMELVHPLKGIPKIKRFGFKQSLTPAQRSTLDRAMEWYRQTYIEKHERKS